MSNARVVKGDRFVADHPDPDRSPYFIEVTRVARDQSWADICVMNWACMWTKRQPLPMPARREDWMPTDIAKWIPGEKP